MVRGLDYYTKTTFEFVHDGLGAQSGIGGGGRYDGLMHQLGGQDLSGIGFGLGVDARCWRCRPKVKTSGRLPGARCSGRRWANRPNYGWRCWPGQLRAAGVRVDLSYGDRGLKAAMRAATGPVPGWRWWPETATSMRERRGQGPDDGGAGRGGD